MDSHQFDQLCRLLERIAVALESGGGSSNGGSSGSSRPTDNCTKLPDGRFKWELTPAHKPRKCKYCGGQVYWMRSRNGKNIPVEADGMSHQDRCGKSGNPVATSSPEGGAGGGAPPF